MGESTHRPAFITCHPKFAGHERHQMGECRPVGIHPKETDENRLVSKFRDASIQVTPQRLIIAGTLFRSGKHASAEELYFLVREKHPKIGLATVYRTLHLLKEKGLVEEHRFNDEFSRYEFKSLTHHDHMICIECGAVVEFGQPVIERLQDLAAQEHNFTIVSHRLDIYGICGKCQSRRNANLPLGSDRKKLSKRT